MTADAHYILKHTFGYDNFRPLQEEIISTILSGRDTVVLMPTGGGKSICFQVPALMREGVTIVISPLIALMNDQVEALRANGIGAAALHSQLSSGEEQDLIFRCRTGEIKLLYLSPEKLIGGLDFFLSQLPVQLVAIDEAHCISSWGHDFRPEYAQLHALKQRLPDIPLIALTATADKTTRRDIVRQLQLSDPAIFISSFDRPNLSLSVRGGVKTKTKLAEISSFIRNRPGEAGIIYCMSRRITEELSETLRQDGFRAGCYHAGLDTSTRNKAQDDFINDRMDVMCATVAFGMGIDKSNVRWVIHYNLPKSVESYYQEIGRAGRDGLPADTVLYYNLGDLVLLAKFAAESGQAEINDAKLRRMQQFAEAGICRRKILLHYFGESVLKDCGNCDVCKNPRTYFDGTELAQKALSALVRLKENVGVNMLIDVLRGSSRSEIYENNYHTIKTYGIGKDIPFADWQHHMLQFLHLGLMEIAYDEGFTLKITDNGRELLGGHMKVELPEIVREASPKEIAKRTKAEKEKSTATPDADLFQALRVLRLQIAKEENVPSYIVFSDAALRDMAAKQPATREQFMNVSGVGEHKLERYGDRFLAAIKTFNGKTAKAETTDEENTTTKKKRERGDSQRETLELWRSGKSLDEIAVQRNLALTTVEGHIAQFVESGEIEDITSLVPADILQRVSQTIESMGFPESMKPIFDALGGEISYGYIRMVFASLRKTPR